MQIQQQIYKTAQVIISRASKVNSKEDGRTVLIDRKDFPIEDRKITPLDFVKQYHKEFELFGIEVRNGETWGDLIYFDDKVILISF